MEALAIFYPAKEFHIRSRKSLEGSIDEQMLKELTFPVLIKT